MSFIFDPRDLIHKPFIDCPKCGSASTFGVLSIYDHSYVRRCKNRNCWYDQGFPLPPLEKKVLYLDQFALSNMMKSLNPKAKSHGKDNLNAFWRELFERVDRLCKLQVLVCPRSEFHSDESLLSPFYDALKRIYELLSGGISFQDKHYIECLHYGEAAKQWVRGVSPPSVQIDRRKVLHGDLTGWHDRLIISVNMTYQDDWLQDIRTHRQRGHAGMASLYEYWRTEKKTFAEVFQNECKEFGITLARLYREYLQTIVDASEGNLPDDPRKLLAPPYVHLVEYIRDVLLGCGVPQADTLRKTFEFFLSPDIQHVPHMRIAGMLNAALARRVVAGMRKPPNEGMMTDLTAISTLMPYCDAMLVDKEFASLLAENPLVDALNYGTKVFSTSSRQALLDYLTELEVGISPEHRKLVEEVYGDDWGTPFTTLYTYKDDDQT